MYRIWEQWQKEYSESGIKDNIYRFLDIPEEKCIWYIGDGSCGELDLKRLLAKKTQDGVICIVCNNTYALSMFAGNRSCPESPFFESLKQNNSSEYTYAREELVKELNELGVEDYTFYYPYPDYKIPLMIYSDRYLPKQGELYKNNTNFGVDRWRLFDENYAWNKVIKDGLFPYLANSYLLVIGGTNQIKELVFSKFSNDRDRRYAIRTDIMFSEDGKCVRKAPVYEESNKHVERLYEVGKILHEAFKNTTYSVLQFEKTNNHSVKYPYLENVTFEDYLIEKLNTQGIESIKSDVEEYAAAIRSASIKTSLVNLDFIFPNVLMTSEGKVVIDYEWAFDKKADNAEDWMKELTADYVIWRSIYLLGNDSLITNAQRKQIYSWAGLAEENFESYYQSELAFQKYVSRQHETIENKYLRLKGNNYDLNEATEFYELYNRINVEVDGLTVDSAISRNKEDITIRFQVKSGVKRVRILLSGIRCAIYWITAHAIGKIDELKYISNSEFEYEKTMLFNSDNGYVELLLDNCNTDEQIEVAFVCHIIDSKPSTWESLLLQSMEEKEKALKLKEIETYGFIGKVIRKLKGV